MSEPYRNVWMIATDTYAMIPYSETPGPFMAPCHGATVIEYPDGDVEFGGIPIVWLDYASAAAMRPNDPTELLGFSGVTYALRAGPETLTFDICEN